MRIVHIGVSAFPPILSEFGGAIQRRVAELAAAQAQRGHEVTVFSPGDDDGVRAARGFRVSYVNCRSAGPLRHIEYQVRALGRIPRAGPGTVIHFHSQPEGAILARGVRAAKVLSYDHYYFRGGRRSPLSGLYRHALAAFDMLLPCSHHCLEESQRYWRLDRARLRILYNGVNLEQFRPLPVEGVRMRQALSIEGRVVLYVGRVCEQKGTDVLLDAYGHIRRRRDDVRLVICGPLERFGNNRAEGEWTRRIRSAGAMYLGPVAEGQLAAVYNMADVFVMPTRRLEMFGMAAVEAQACGKAVVASDAGGLRETVPVSCGARCEVGNSEQLAAAIEELLDDADRREACARNAVANAARFEWSQVAQELDAIYDGILRDCDTVMPRPIGRGGRPEPAGPWADRR